MRRILAGIVVGALAMKALDNSSSKLRKGKKAVIKKVEDMLHL